MPWSLVCGAPKRRFRPYQPAVTKDANDLDVRKARKAQIKRDEAIGYYSYTPHFLCHYLSRLISNPIRRGNNFTFLTHRWHSLDRENTGRHCPLRLSSESLHLLDYTSILTAPIRFASRVAKQFKRFYSIYFTTKLFQLYSLPCFNTEIHLLQLALLRVKFFDLWKLILVGQM